jgi:hypothetical protein
VSEIQRAFSSGEVSPSLYGRADVDRWKAALKTCRNFIPKAEGGIVNRQGVEFIQSISSTTNAHFIPFEFGPTDSYVLVGYTSGSDRIGVIRNGAAVPGDPIMYDCVLVDTGSVRNIETPYAHLFAAGDKVRISTDGSPPSGSELTITVINSPTNFRIGTSVGAGTLTGVKVVRSTALATPAMLSFGAYFDAATARFVQSGDTIFLADGQVVPQRIVREDEDGYSRNVSWHPDTAPLTPAIITGITVAATGSAGTNQIRYRVTRTDKDGLESGVLRGSTITGTATLAGNRWNINFTAHGLETNDTVEVTEAKDNTAGALTYKVGDLVRVVKVDADNFTVVGNGAVSGNFKYRALGDSFLGAYPSTSTAATITWTAVADADFYNVYREFGRVYGYIGSTSDVTFTDNGIVPDQKDTPIIGNDPTRAINDNGANVPSAVGLFQQRLMFGGFSEDTERIVGSHVGNYTAFDPGAEDASGVDFELAGRTVSAVQHMLEIAGRAVVLTSTAEWVLRGGTGGGLTPTAINARADSYNGCSSITPALVGSTLLYVQRGDKIVRDSRYDFAQEALDSRDLTLWAKHLFQPGLVRVVYQRSEQVVWCLRTDGVLLALTYIPEQEIWGWSRHDIDGREITDICAVSEDNRDRLYCMVQNDSTTFDVCRMPLEWESGDVDDHIGFDEAVTYDGTLAYTGTLTGGTTWKTTETLTLTAAGSVFVGGDVGKVFMLRSEDDDVYVTCTAYASGTSISVTPNTLIPTSLRAVAADTLFRCTDTLTGLTHLEGLTVGVIADRSREADTVVASGSITLSRNFARIQAGIIITCEAVTLDLEASERDTALGDFKHITRVILNVVNTRGAQVGLNSATLEPMFPEYVDLTNAPPALQNGMREVIMQAAHSATGSITIVQDEGLPTTILNARTVFNMGTER